MEYQGVQEQNISRMTQLINELEDCYKELDQYREFPEEVRNNNPRYNEILDKKEEVLTKMNKLVETL